MAALTLLHQSASLGSGIEFAFERMGEPQGAEDKQIRDNAQVAVAHWMNRAECLLVAGLTDQDYVSVPFKAVKRIHVKYRRAEALKPAPYPLDE